MTETAMAPSIATPSSPQLQEDLPDMRIDTAQFQFGPSLRSPVALTQLLWLCLGLCLAALAAAPILAQGAAPEEKPPSQQERSTTPIEVDPQARLTETFDQASDRLMLLVSYLPLLAVSLIVVAIFFFLSRWIGNRELLFSKLSHNRFARDLSRQAVQIGIFLMGVLIALEILNATALVSAVLGTAGVFGLAVGFAFRDLVENYIASVLLSLRQPFSPNDHVRIGDLEGKVVRLTSRATILMTLDGNHLRIPNAQVFKGVILNFSRNPKRRFDFGVGVGVGEDLNEARELGLAALEHMPGVLDDPAPMAVIQELGDSNVLIRFYGWVDQREVSFSKVKGESIRLVKTELEEAGMDLPEPIYRVHMVTSGGGTDAGPEVRVEAQAETAEQGRGRSVESETPTDIRPDLSLEQQIAEDRSGSDEDLLYASANTE